MTERERRHKIAKTAVVSAILVISFYFAILRYQELMAVFQKLMHAVRPIIIGFVFAFLMNPIMRWFDRKIQKVLCFLFKDEEKGKKLSHTISAIIALILLIGAITAVVYFLIMSLIPTVMDLSKTLLPSINRAEILFTKFLEEREISLPFGENGFTFELITRFVREVSDWFTKNNLTKGNIDLVSLIPAVTNGVSTAGKVLLDVLIGLFIAIFILFEKKDFKAQAKKLMLAFCSVKTTNKLLTITRKSADIFYGFIVGKIIDSAIIGMLCYVAMTVLGLPYAGFCSLIIGVTNIIPVFGPYIGAVPTTLIILIINPKQGLIFAIMVLILQQLDGNVIGPKILGESTGLSAFWVIVSITIGGSLFGILGMLLAVPTMAVIYYLVGVYVEDRIRQKNLSSNVEDYLLLESVDEVTGEFKKRTQYEDDNKHTGIFKNKNKKSPAKKDYDKKSQNPVEDKKNPESKTQENIKSRPANKPTEKNSTSETKAKQENKPSLESKESKENHGEKKPYYRGNRRRKPKNTNTSEIKKDNQ